MRFRLHTHDPGPRDLIGYAVAAERGWLLTSKSAATITPRG
jgi:hypothetical protein